MSAEPERLFSGARRTVSWARCRLSARTIEMLECIKHWIKTGLDQPVDGEEDEDIIEASPESEQEVDWDELTTENLAEHVRRFAQDEELDPEGAISRAELFAMASIPLVGCDEDSDVFASDREDGEDGICVVDDDDLDEMSVGD